jgi:anthranilate synthase/aminodeoxychorismate synthase-like glutamine amidotransferase
LILVIDNYDSFTWNRVQYLGELGTEPVVRRNDEITVEEVRQLAPDRIVISPGPCTPMEAGVSIELIREVGPEVPTLGVCLGHQAIGAAFGGEVVRARRVMHGKVCPIRHRATDIFDQLPTPLRVTRYHSLVVEPSSLPDELEAIAWTDEVGFEDEIQALRHRRFPIWGVQFHPESIASEGGHQMLRNFLAL